ncbi:PstS family phosphate ABC transporter substrate-binding protein [Marinicrinis sediminis]|uniref:Phosphate-binding protein n=1 Tax=Marinicrinis sediminis TaxID=1652465 RepID=A0ABW5RAA8_9BACL
MFKGFIRKGSIILSTVVLATSLAACGGNNNGAANNTNNNSGAQSENTDVSGSITIDGSSTVYPVSQAVAEEFMAAYPDVDVTVNVSGSSNGFAKLIEGEIDIADASRKIKDKEVAGLQEKGEEAVQMPVAYDGITVVIHPENDWAKEMTVEQLKMIWEKDSKVEKWSDVDPSWPQEDIHLYGPGTASGTFEYFTEEINGEAKVSREDYQASEDDNVLVTGVTSDKYAMGYFGFAYYLENQGSLASVAIKNTGADNFVSPTLETIADGSYAPLSREVYIYPKKSVLERPEIKEFIKFYMSEEGKALVEEVGYVPLGEDLINENLKHVQ